MSWELNNDGLWSPEGPRHIDHSVMGHGTIYCSMFNIEFHSPVGSPKYCILFLLGIPTWELELRSEQRTAAKRVVLELFKKVFL